MRGYWRAGEKLVALLIGSLGILASAITHPSVAFAAEIKADLPNKKGGSVLILIDGDIKSGDDEKFRKIAAEYSDAIVLLNSDGGMIGPAMDIGRTVKLRSYKTAVYKNGSCASACALIWVAGSRRIVFEGAEVGFHASYLDTDGTKLETGVGNALVGHYLSQLGFGEKTVVFATLAPPDKILWLNERTASKSGIDFETIRDDAKPPTPKVAARQPAPQQQADASSVLRSRNYGQFMGEAKQTLRSPEAFVQALRQKGFQASISDESAETPTIEVGVGGEIIALSFSGCGKKGCNYIQLLDYFNDLTKVEANIVIAKTLKEEYYSHPIWLESSSSLAMYNYIVIGSEGIPVQTLIENMKYFVQSNNELLNTIVELRAKR